METERMSSESTRLAYEVSSMAFVGLLLLLTFIFSQKIPEWQSLASHLLAVAVVYSAAVWSIRFLPEGFLSTTAHMTAFMILFSFVFQAVFEFQHIFVGGWMDEVLISWEYAVVGTESTIFLQQFINPVLTEWMMFAYVIYVPLLPLIALICYWSSGVRATDEYLLNLSLAYILCYIGFILFPVAGPLDHYPEIYATPLEGSIFTWFGDWIRDNVHHPGGCLPSPHCAAGTVILVTLYRYSRKLFYFTLPVLLTLYVSTVYGRYHYTADAITGILTGILVLKCSPKFVAVVHHTVGWLKRSLASTAAPESTSD
jgi:hypothetical protein